MAKRKTRMTSDSIDMFAKAITQYAFRSGPIEEMHSKGQLSQAPPADDANIGGQDQAQSESHEPQQTPPQKTKGKKSGGNTLKPEPPQKNENPVQPEVKSDGQS